MIRIIAGKYKGRFLKVPDSKTTRPTMDKVRQAIFSALKDKVEDSIFLDLFAGSGSIGLEAISRGCKECYFIEKDPKTFKTLKENALSFSDDQDKIHLIFKDYRLFLKKASDVKFDIVYLDPPYRYKINKDIIIYLDKFSKLASEAIIISEQDNKNEEIEGFEMKEYRYGQKFVSIYRRNI